MTSLFEIYLCFKNLFYNLAVVALSQHEGTYSIKAQAGVKVFDLTYTYAFLRLSKILEKHW